MLPCTGAEHDGSVYELARILLRTSCCCCMMVMPRLFHGNKRKYTLPFSARPRALELAFSEKWHLRLLREDPEVLLEERQQLKSNIEDQLDEVRELNRGCLSCWSSCCLGIPCFGANTFAFERAALFGWHLPVSLRCIKLGFSSWA